MVFNSLTFVVFFALVLGIHSLPLPWIVKKINLLIASYVFYAAWNPPFVILLWVSTVVDWYAARGLVLAKRKASRYAWMLLSVVANLGMLGYFKYANFFADNVNAMFLALGVHPLAVPRVLLPIGISFFTFHALSYLVDIYRGTARHLVSPIDFALYIAFFPQLIAGPIMAYLPIAISRRLIVGWQIPLNIFDACALLRLWDSRLPLRRTLATGLLIAASPASFLVILGGTMLVSTGYAPLYQTADQLAARDVVARPYEDRRQVAEAGRDPAAVVDFDEVAVAAAVPASAKHSSVCGCIDRRAVSTGKVDAGVHGSATLERIGTDAEAARELDVGPDWLV